MPLRTEQEKVAHLLRRFGLGASEAEMDYYGKDGLKGAIDRLINYDQVEDNWTYSLDMVRNQQGNLPVPVGQAFWYSRILTTNRPLQEKMTIFWHDHFATSAMKVDVAPVMHAHIDVLRQGALGSFPELLLSVSKDPAMLYWLDNHENVRGKPNENFAREVMELFTLGIGHYSEKDVQEAARAFTGWTFGLVGAAGRFRRQPKPRGPVQFVIDESAHDNGEKVILGRRANFNGDEVLDLLCREAATPRFLVKKMWEWFAYPNPSLSLVEKLSTRFVQSGLNIKTLVRSIMESPEFYSEAAEKGVVKSPVDFCVSTARAFGYNNFQLQMLAAAKEGVEEGQYMRSIALGGLLYQATRSMGMTLMMPPDVAGWDIGKGWISSATMVERMKWAERLFNPANRNNGTLRSQPPIPGQNAYFYGVLGSPTTAEEAVKGLLSVLDAQALSQKLPTLVQAAEATAQGPITERNIVLVARVVTRAIFGSPEFQFA
jgi:uncharacterized protein (DUF1800 family)